MRMLCHLAIVLAQRASRTRIPHVLCHVERAIVVLVLCTLDARSSATQAARQAAKSQAKAYSGCSGVRWAQALARCRCVLTSNEQSAGYDFHQDLHDYS